MVIIILALTIGVLVISAGLYLGICFTETSADRVRLVVRKGVPLRIQSSGWGFIWTPFEHFYDYSKNLIRFDFEAEKVFTKSTTEVDENVAFIDSVIYFLLVETIDEDEGNADKCFKEVSRLWKRGLRPNAGQMISDGSAILLIVQPFVQAKQREVGHDMHWRNLAYTGEFVKQMQTVLNEVSEDNPFYRLGLVKITYEVKTIRFDEKMEASLNALARATQEGEATIKRAEDDAEARQKVLKVIEEHPQAASIVAIESTENNVVFAPSKDGAISILLGGASS